MPLALPLALTEMHPRRASATNRAPTLLRLRRPWAIALTPFPTGVPTLALSQMQLGGRPDSRALSRGQVTARAKAAVSSSPAHAEARLRDALKARVDLATRQHSSRPGSRQV